MFRNFSYPLFPSLLLTSCQKLINSLGQGSGFAANHVVNSCTCLYTASGEGNGTPTPVLLPGNPWMEEPGRL